MDKVLLIDGSCGFCLLSVRLIIKWESSPEITFVNNQSRTGLDLLKEYGLGEAASHTIIYVESGAADTQSSAILKVCRSLKFPASWLYYLIFIPKFIRDSVYNLIAKNRYRLHENKHCSVEIGSQLSSRIVND